MKRLAATLIAFVLVTGCGGAGGEDLFGGERDGGAVEGGAALGSLPAGDAGGSESPDGATGAGTPPDASTGPLDASRPALDAGRDTGPVCQPEACLPTENCGPKVDACGNHYDCGTCAAPDTCVSNHCAACVPKACPALRPCGDMDDGCGHTVTCQGTCAPQDTCGGAGVPNQCDNFTKACSQTKTTAQPVCVGVYSSTTYRYYCALSAIDPRWCTTNQTVPACPAGSWVCNFG